jgi:hypothetical protein
MMVMLDDGTKIATRMLIWTGGQTPETPAPVLASLPCAKQRGRIVADRLSSGARLSPVCGRWAIARSCLIRSVRGMSLSAGRRNTPRDKPRCWRAISWRYARPATAKNHSSLRFSACSPPSDGALA